MIYCRIIIGILMIILSVCDIRKRRISLVVVGAIAVLGVAFRLVFGPFEIAEVLLGIAIGALILLLAFVSRQSIGYGDGWLLCATGIVLGFKYNMIILFVGCLICAIFSGCLLILKKGTRKTQLPFVPFLSAAYWVITLISISERTV